MNDQKTLAPEHAARLASLRFRQELLQKDAQLLQVELQLFQAQMFMVYGNPGEAIEIGPDGSVTRKPQAPSDVLESK